MLCGQEIHMFKFTGSRSKVTSVLTIDTTLGPILQRRSVKGNFSYIMATQVWHGLDSHLHWVNVKCTIDSDHDTGQPVNLLQNISELSSPYGNKHMAQIKTTTLSAPTQACIDSTKKFLRHD